MQTLKKLVTYGLLISGLLSGLVMPVAAVVPVETRSLEDWLAILDDKDGGVNNVDDWDEVVEAAQVAVAEVDAAMADYMMQLDFSEEEDIDTLKYYADLESSNAQFYLGLMYDTGKGVRQDYDKAREWYLKAANQGVAEAQFNLGLMYSKGQGVQQDYKKAAEWYQESASHGDAHAQFNLGDMYRDGKGVRQDYKKAAEWYRKAAKKNHTPSQYNLGVAYNNGLGVTKNKAIAKEWFGKACDNGLQDGCEQYRILNLK